MSLLKAVEMCLKNGDSHVFLLRCVDHGRRSRMNSLENSSITEN